MTQLASTASARLHLRQATADLHQAVEIGFSGLDLDDPGDYLAFLDTHAAALAPLEAWADAADAPRLLPDWQERKRLAALQADIRDLGGKASPCPNGQLPMPAIHTDEASLAGVLYVLEGSRLGARVILNDIETSPDFRVRKATRFLRHGEGRNFWSNFLTVLDEAVRDDDDLRRAGAAANAAFEIFLNAVLPASSKHSNSRLARA